MERKQKIINFIIKALDKFFHILWFVVFVFLIPHLAIIVTLICIFTKGNRVLLALSIPINLLSLLFFPSPLPVKIVYYILMIIIFIKFKLWKLLERSSGTQVSKDNTFAQVFNKLSDSEAKKEYLNLMKKHHPDQGGDPEIAKQITEAYQHRK